ncbi:GntR family transcriptional regulator [Amycolatopsis endophytica]|uniref:DNA-binding GntR family transcriptional regulator n=1 Tax=Amycolatopsis endophytica TaxID=860233 RepID=A0A853BA32_9PSEU|nr:GntR family transcriptional regulator [Amycolatopsis endophytica]NYI91634.1 DNA-binding GntR family transcriptional regulator [Amycolatopsis endophytica]
MAENGLAAEFGGDLLSDKVKRLVLDRIIHGHYKPGERVVEFQLSKELGISQSPVRDALRELAAIGVITMHARRGARVRMPSAKELADVSQVRAEIDGLAARLAVARMSPASLSSLRELVDDMLDKLADGDFPAVTDADVRFHEIIVQASGNRALEQTFSQLAPFARTFLTLTLPDVDVREIVLEHQGILEALTAGDADGAAEAARRHQLNVRSLMLDHASATGGVDSVDGAAQVS